MTVQTNLLKLFNPAGPTNQQNVATGTTTTASATVNVTPNSWIVAGMEVFDVTVGAAIGTVSAYTFGASTLTLTANASHAIATGDVLQYGFTPSDVQVGATVGSDIRALVEVCSVKVGEINAIISYLETNVITSSQDSAANALLAAAVTALS